MSSINNVFDLVKDDKNILLKLLFASIKIRYSAYLSEDEKDKRNQEWDQCFNDYLHRPTFTEEC